MYKNNYLLWSGMKLFYSFEFISFLTTGHSGDQQSKNKIENNFMNLGGLGGKAEIFTNSNIILLAEESELSWIEKGRWVGNCSSDRSLLWVWKKYSCILTACLVRLSASFAVWIFSDALSHSLIQLTTQQCFWKCGPWWFYLWKVLPNPVKRLCSRQSLQMEHFACFKV